MVVGEANINNIMGGIENTGSVRLHNHRKKLKQRFDIIKKLGQGTYGKVQLGINKETGQEVAIKTIKKSKIETEADLVRIRREIQIMSSVQHPNIIHIYEVFENREKMVLVMEYAAGGELYDYLSERKVLAEEEARRIFRQIATACYYCHKHKICHRDLKLENILLDEQGNAKIADFGLSNVFDDQRLLSTFCGSPLYASPEIVKGTPYQGPEVDCWSLGVLLYTLVYGAMPFDGSNFKRLVRQISQGDYFEPKKPSRASPLIRDMLTVNPRNRANIEKICAHWWVNEGYDDSCLDISEELANQTPVRLDLLLSLAPPAPQLESEKLVVTGETADEAGMNSENALPTRSQSVGSLMDFTNPAERRIKDLLSEDAKVSPKRKLEATVSTDQVNLSKDGVKRKEKIIKENTIADITLHAPIQENALLEDANMSEGAVLNKSATQTLSREMDVEQTEEYVDPSSQGAACTEIIEDAKKTETKKSSKIPSNRILKEPNEISGTEKVANNVDKENFKKEINKDKVSEEKAEEKQKQEQSKIPAKRKSIKKKVLTDKNENSGEKQDKADKKQPEANEQPKSENKVETEEAAQPPNKPVERRRSRIFETAEKFQNMISANENKPAGSDKPKKLVIPGVSVGGYKKEFERKASLTTPGKNLLKKSSVDQEEPVQEAASGKVESAVTAKSEVKPKTGSIKPPCEENKAVVEKQVSGENDRSSQVKNAVNIISSALDKDGTKKSKSRPCMTRKPPVPFGTSGRSASGTIPTIPSPQSPPAGTPQTPVESKQSQASNVHGSTPAQVIEQAKEEIPEENKTSSAEITLKSATLPRRKTTKAEIKLDYPAPKPATMGFKTEMAHHVEGLPKLPTQRSEVTFPVTSPTIGGNFRSASVEPESRVKQSPRERIIPISFEREPTEEKKELLPSPSVKPPTKTFQTQKSTVSQRSNSLSRQSTQESDSETTTSTGEPIRKSPREYIIPIAVEGGGYVTPRAGSLEPSDTASTTSTMTSKSKFGRNRRLNDREGSEDESPFAALHRHSSFGRDSDTEDPRRDMFRMHSLRSSRPRKAAIEHNDSFSSGEDDDDDGFEILTAENLFSTLLSRVRDLTQRLNVDGRPGFPTSRLLSSHFDHGTNFWNLHNRMDPLTRYAPIGRSSREQSVDSSASSRNAGAPWRRSVSRDLASDIESVVKSTVPTPTHTATLPRGDPMNRENLNLTDLDLKQLKLSDEDALALSYLTPGLSRRIQKQLLAQLAPAEVRKLSRTLSMRSPSENKSTEENKFERKGTDGAASTLPRRFSVESSPMRYQNLSNKSKIEPNVLDKMGERSRTPTIIPSISASASVVEEPMTFAKPNKSFLPVKSSSHDYYAPLSEQTAKYSGLEYPKSAHSQNSSINQPTRRLRSPSLVEPKFNYLQPKTDSSSLLSPDTSTSESLSNKIDDYSYRNTSSISSASNLSDSSRLSKYLSPATVKYCETVPRPYTPSALDTDRSTSEIRRRSPSARRTSRFLRPDFYEGLKEGNYYLKEKKERELETQKVLKEIRDKRKCRFRERSVSRENGQVDDGAESFDDNVEVVGKVPTSTLQHNNISICEAKSTDNLLKNVSDNIKNLESNVSVNSTAQIVKAGNKLANIDNQKIPDYVNVPSNQVAEENKVPDYVNVSKNNEPIVKKGRSKIARPKSYPTETNEHKELASKIPELYPPEKSKVSKLKKPEKSKEVENDKQSNKNKFLQTIEKKFEKLRSFSNSPTSISSEEMKAREEKKSTVEDTIKRLREQSLPRNMDHCITESGLIKRAVSVEDLSSSDPKQLQASRKSVTKILNLFKKFEEKGSKKNEKTKTRKGKDVTKKPKEDVKKTKSKNSQLDTEKTDQNDTEQVGAVTVISNNSESDIRVRDSMKSPINDVESETKIVSGQKAERPRSLLLDRVKQFQPISNGARSDNNIAVIQDSKLKGSKLPVTSFRRSLNLENTQLDPPRFYKNPSGKTPSPEVQQTGKLDKDNLQKAYKSNSESKMPDRSKLKLDLKVAHQTPQPTASTSYAGTLQNMNLKENYNPLTLTTDDSLVFLSPCDGNDASCDSWSVCSDYNTQDLTSPVSPGSHFYSADENESVSDRIRRKSFYTRFNEKKRPRKSTLGNYRDLDLYKDMNNRKSSYRPTDYTSLDRSVDLGSKCRKSYYSAVAPEPLRKGYTRSNTTAFTNDGYDNVTNQYETSNPRSTRRSSSYAPDSQEVDTLDDAPATGKNRMYSYNQPSRFSNTPFSPTREHPIVETVPSSINQNTVRASTSQNYV